MIPNIIIQIANGEKEIKLGSVTPTRDFNFVTDTCRGFLSLANNEAGFGEVFNIGSNTEISILDTFNLISKIMDSDTKIISDNQRIRPKKSEVERLICDNTKIKEITNYKPQVNIKEGLKVTIEWLSEPENLKKYKSEI